MNEPNLNQFEIYVLTYFHISGIYHYNEITNQQLKIFFIAESEKSHQLNPHHLLLCPPGKMELGWNRDHRDMTLHCLDQDLDKFCGFGD